MGVEKGVYGRGRRDGAGRLWEIDRLTRRIFSVTAAASAIVAENVATVPGFRCPWPANRQHKTVAGLAARSMCESCASAGGTKGKASLKQAGRGADAVDWQAGAHPHTTTVAAVLNQ